MGLEDKTETRVIQGKEVTVVIEVLTKEEARKMFPYRPENRYSESRFGGNNYADDACLLINKFAKRCIMCRAPTKNDYLNEGNCPDCDGRSEYNGTDPRAGS